MIWLLAGVGQTQVPVADNPEAWKGLTQDQVKKVKAGEIVILDKNLSSSDEAKRFIQTAMIFNQPIDAVWTLLSQTEKQEQYLRSLFDSPIIETHPTWNLSDFYVKVAFIDLKYRVRHDFESEKYYFHWNLDPSHENDLKHLEGYWRFYKIDQSHTLARYGTIVVVSELIPKSIMEEMTRRDLPESMQSVKKYVESGGTYAKPGYVK